MKLLKNKVSFSKIANCIFKTLLEQLTGKAHGRKIFTILNIQLLSFRLRLRLRAWCWLGSTWDKVPQLPSHEQLIEGQELSFAEVSSKKLVLVSRS